MLAMYGSAQKFVMSRRRGSDQLLDDLCVLLDEGRNAHEAAVQSGDHRLASEIYCEILSVCLQIDELICVVLKE